MSKQIKLRCNYCGKKFSRPDDFLVILYAHCESCKETHEEAAEERSRNINPYSHD